MDPIQLDGRSLTIEDLVYVARDPGAQIKCTEEALNLVDKAAREVKKTVKEYRRSVGAKEPYPMLEYGVTTGFGEFKTIPIDPKRLKELQANILLSHSAGVGETLEVNDLSNYYPADVVRAVLVLRINAFLNGYSGIRRQLVLAAEAMVNKGIIPLVPLKGSVGSSGDLAPLSHLFVAFCKAGRKNKSVRFYRFSSNPGPPMLEPAAKLPAIIGKRLLLEPTAKEGLALTNGASFAAAMLALAVHDAKEIAVAADLAAAMTAEALLGCARAFDARVHQARAQEGQKESAARIRTMLEGSKLLETHDTVQDPYSIRCAPAVHGASVDALEYGTTVARRELNAATDNPLFFRDGDPWDEKFRDNWSSRSGDRLKRPPGGSAGKRGPTAYNGSRRRSYSAGNFHGQPCAVAADVMAIALSEFANISERRTQLLMDKDHNRGLPSNLIPDAGLHSGFMIAQYCAAALVSENKVLAHPASVDSIPTSANSEDHNAMAPIATRKLRTILANARHTLAIELLVAAQALEWAALFHRIKTRTLPQKLRKGAGKYVDLKNKAKDKERSDQVKRRRKAWALGKAEKHLFERWTSGPNRKCIAESLSPGTAAAYLRIREAVEPMIVDRVLTDDIRNVAMLLAPNGHANSELIEAVRGVVSI